MEGQACFGATLETAPQAFGVLMVNFDSHVIDARAALAGLVGCAAIAVVLLVSGLVLTRADQPPAHRRRGVALLVAATVIDALSAIGVTEHLGLALLG